MAVAAVVTAATASMGWLVVVVVAVVSRVVGVAGVPVVAEGVREVMRQHAIQGSQVVLLAIGAEGPDAV
jgi:hypothetical protein